MIRDLIAGIAEKLDTELGHPVYEDSTKQNLTGPCFYVKRLPSDEKPLLGSRYKRRYSLDVHFFPANETDPNAELDTMAESLYEMLEYVKLGDGLVRGLSMRADPQGGVLHFFVSYDVFVLKSEPADDPMDELHIIQPVV